MSNILIYSTDILSYKISCFSINCCQMMLAALSMENALSHLTFMSGQLLMLSSALKNARVTMAVSISPTTAKTRTTA